MLSRFPCQHTQAAMIAFGAFIVGVLTLAIQHRVSGTLLRGWDSQFYYARAHSIAFRGSFDLTESIEGSPWTEDFGDEGIGNLPRRNDKVVSKYPVGLSLVEVPFIWLGEKTSRIIPRPSDRVRMPGWRAVTILTFATGMMAIYAIGFGVLFALLTKQYATSDAIWGCAACWLGTSLFFYTAVNPFMAHGLGFVVVVITVAVCDQLQRREHFLVKETWLLGGLFGFLLLTRPQQVTLLPIVLICTPRNAITKITAGNSVVFFLVFAAVALTQPISQYSTWGAFTLNAYAKGGEGFDFLHPDLWTVLVSPYRGLLFISPVVIVSICRLLLPVKYSFPERVYLLHFGTQLFLVTCWSSPDQGNSFSARMCTEAIPTVAFSLCSILTYLKANHSIFCSHSLKGGVLLAMLWNLRLVTVFAGQGTIHATETYLSIIRKALLTS